MSGLQFTPGPWFVKQAYGHDARHWVMRTEYGQGWVRERRVDHGDGGLSEADANLVAAAPELYEALQKIIDCYGVGYTDPAKFCKDVYDWMVEGQHALAKARGGQ
jgi:hypothetical protein